MFNNSGLGWKIGMGIGAAILGGSAFGAGASSFRNSRIPGGGYGSYGSGGSEDFTEDISGEGDNENAEES